MLSKAQIGYCDISDEQRRVEFEYQFDKYDGFKTCLVGCLNQSAVKNSLIDSIFSFNDDGLNRVYVDAIISPKEKEIKSVQMFECELDGIAACLYEYSCVNKSEEKFSNRVAIGI